MNEKPQDRFPRHTMDYGGPRSETSSLTHIAFGEGHPLQRVAEIVLTAMGRLAAFGANKPQ